MSVMFAVDECKRSDTYIDAFVREAWGHGGAFLFCLGKEDRKLVDSRHRNIATIVAGEKGLRNS